jgi:hypothetical protein
MYGVSPQPAQAPEYSKSGCRNCEPLTSALRSFVRSGRAGQEELVVRALGSRSGGCGAMSIALCFGFDLSLAGQTITQSVQPVQSSGATWIVYFCP